MKNNFLDYFNKIIQKPSRILIFLIGKGLFNWLPDKIFLKIKFRINMGYTLDLDNPVTFNEKIQWLKLFDRRPLYTKLVDKYEVREHIRNIVGDDYLVPLIGVYNNFSEIDFDELPEKFVLKCTHDSGGVIICKNKNEFDKASAKKKIEKLMSKNFYKLHREWPYKDIKPRILCEMYLEDSENGELIDYKFMCFNGEVKCLFLCLNRNSDEGLNVDFYDLSWNPLPFERHYPNSGKVIPKPLNFDLMVEFAEKLSKNIPFVRVDYYEVNGKLFFGELTFYPGSGYEEFTPDVYDYELGSWIELPR